LSVSAPGARLALLVAHPTLSIGAKRYNFAIDTFAPARFIQAIAVMTVFSEKDIKRSGVILKAR